MNETKNWKPINTAPFQQVVWVRNPQMKEPVKATRGYRTEAGVHPDDTFFTSVFTNDKFFPFPSGQLVIPTEWAEADDHDPAEAALGDALLSVVKAQIPI